MHAAASRCAIPSETKTRPAHPARVAATCPIQTKMLYEEEQKSKKIVVYITSNSVVRGTIEKSNAILKLLGLFRVKVPALPSLHAAQAAAVCRPKRSIGHAPDQ